MNKGCFTSLEILVWALQIINWPIMPSQLVFIELKIVYIILFQRDFVINGWSLHGRSWLQSAAAVINWCWAGCYRPRPAAPGRHWPQPAATVANCCCPGRSRLQPWQIGTVLAATCTGRNCDNFFPRRPWPAGTQINWPHPAEFTADHGPRPAAANGHRCHALLDTLEQIEQLQL